MNSDGTTHALVVPWPVTNLQTWCGTPAKRLENISPQQFVASAPDAVTCPRCRSAMRRALQNLQEWVPQLPSDKSPGDEKEKHSYFCPYCNDIVAEVDTNKRIHPPVHKACGTPVISKEE